MDLIAAQKMALDLMAEYGVTGFYRFEWTRAKTQAGITSRGGKRGNIIGLSAPLTQVRGEAEVRNTILHEIAHAIVGPHQGHNALWRKTFIAIGGDGSRLATDQMPDMRKTFVVSCPNCGELGRVKNHRRPTRYDRSSHRPCGTRITVALARA